LSRKRRPEPRVTVAKTEPPRWQREQNISRILWIVIPVIIALIAVLVGYWGCDTYVRVWSQPVAKVNGETLDMDHFVKMLRLYTVTTGAAVDPYQVLRAIEENELIRQEATRLGLEVPDDDVTREIAAVFPIEGAGDDPIVPSGNGTAGSSSGNESSASSGNDTSPVVIVDPSPSPDAGNQTAVPEIGDSYERWLDGMRISDREYRRFVETALLGALLREHFEDEVPGELEHVYLHIIPVDTLEIANEAADRLDAGEDFAELARELGTIDDVAEAGGDLGWVPRGLLTELDDVAFNLEIGNVSDPIATTDGYRIIKVTDSAESMEVIDEYRIEIARADFESWLLEAREIGVEEYLDEDGVAFARDHLA
jgi:hypothetical protein